MGDANNLKDRFNCKMMEERIYEAIEENADLWSPCFQGDADIPGINTGLKKHTRIHGEGSM